ncbi:hypothetical protein Tco_0876194 [Tanacetum coccineum]|uniref:Uncharacterized protein n=1 Tax=Tanacetum coccineum TaxID=301880 RepID=A0ABQ5BUN7_9ASTR
MGGSYYPISLALFFPSGRTTKLHNDYPECSNNIMEYLYQKHGLVSRTYSKKSFIMASPFGSKSKSFLTMSTPSQQYNISDHRPVYCMEDPGQAFVEYASSRTDEARDARLSKFEADFKRQQGEMTNKIDIVLKVITDRIAGTLPSNAVKNPKLGTTPVLSARSYPTIDPQCLSRPSNSINAIKAHFKEATFPKPSQPEEPEPTFKDEFQDLHLNLPVLEVLAHAPIYNAILDKYVESLELGKNRSTFVQERSSTWTTSMTLDI